jgi:hypothetical protein
MEEVMEPQIDADVAESLRRCGQPVEKPQPPRVVPQWQPSGQLVRCCCGRKFRARSWRTMCPRCGDGGILEPIHDEPGKGERVCEFCGWIGFIGEHDPSYGKATPSCGRDN